MTATLTSSQVAATVQFFAQNAYVAPNVTASNGTDVLAVAVQNIDAAVSISIASGSASANVSVSLIGNFTATQLELLMAYVLLKRAGAI